MSIPSLMINATHASGGIEATYHGSVENTTDTNSSNFSVPASVPDNCLLVVCLGHEGGNSINGLTGGGYTWTEVVGAVQFGSSDAAIYAAEVTTAPTTITMSTGQNTFRSAAQFYSIVKYSSATAVDTGRNGGASTSSDNLTLTGIQEGDAMIAFCAHSNVGTTTWTGVTKNYDTNTSENNSTFTGGFDYTGSGVTSQFISASLTASAGAMCLVAAAWR